MAVPGKKIMVLAGLGGFILLGLLAAKPPEEEKPAYKNLKVLSSRISDENMDYVMESINADLGVTCLFCHPGKLEGTRFRIDYASDEYRNKRIARDMLRMTFRLNKKYFNTKMNGAMTTRGRIWCRTCHRGLPVPIFTVPGDKE
jgi:hypothetical protein